MRNVQVKAGQEAIGAEHAVPLVLGPITLVRPPTIAANGRAWLCLASSEGDQ